MEILFKNIWFMFIVVTIANALVLKYRSKKYIAQNPELKEGYDDYVKGYLFYGNIPWVIMMIGNLSGMTQNTFEFFSPKDLNPIVLIFHGSLVMLWILGARWVYFKNGAEFMEAHPGLLQKSSFSGNKEITAKQIKLFFPLLLFGGILALIMMWFSDNPTASF